MPLNNTYSILSTIAAVAADISLSNHVLSITGCPAMDFRTLEAIGGYITPVAETRGVLTFTNTGANSTAYKGRVTQYIPSIGQLSIVDFGTTSPASGSTTTTVSTSLKADLNARLNLKIAATGTTTTIITASAGSPIITGTAISGGTFAITTPGVASVGTYADLVAAGVTGATAGKTYNQITFVYKSPIADLLGEARVTNNSHTLYVQSDATNYAAFNTRMAELLSSFPAGGSTYSDSEALALA